MTCGACRHPRGWHDELGCVWLDTTRLGAHVCACRGYVDEADT